MKAYCYTRAENEESAETRSKLFKEWCEANKHEFAAFRWDGMAGQLGLTKILRKAEAVKGTYPIIAVWTLSDLSRDLTKLVKQIDELCREQGIAIYARATDLWIKPHTETGEVIEALAAAHVRYAQDNRKRGIASAREAGATIGRPRDARFQLKVARETIVDLTRAKDGRLPSSRKLAKAVKCGETTARKLLAEYRAEKRLSNEQENGES